MVDHRPSPELERATTLDGEPRARDRSSTERSISEESRLIWITPDGTERELVPEAIVVHPTATCDRCGPTSTLNVIVREHRTCGYVSFDGMVSHEDGRAHTCPKCETTANTGFPEVGTIHVCADCGKALDRAVE